MSRDGSATREKILDSAQEFINDFGFSGTSIDMVIDKAGITKGAFFHHFKSKAELAKALVDRYAANDVALYEDFNSRAEKFSRDPLQQLLIFLGLLHEMTEAMTEPYTCLFASFCYQGGLFGEDVKGVISGTLGEWRDKLHEKLKLIAAQHPPKIEVDLESLADHLNVVLEGAYIMAKTYDDAKVVSAQLLHYKNYLELLFGVHD